MKRKIISLILMGALAVPFVGCNANFNVKSPQTSQNQEYHENHEHYESHENTSQHSDDYLIKIFNEGVYTLTYDGNEYKIQVDEFIEWLFGDSVNTTVYENSNDISYIYVSNDYGEYAIFAIDMETNALYVVEIGYTDGSDIVAVYDEQAQEIIVEFLCEYVGVGQQEEPQQQEQPKQKQPKQEPKQEQPKQENKSDDPMAPDGKHMESTAPYGRCPKCNCALGSDKSYQGNYCDDCFAKIKEEEYREKHQYGDCIDCGVYLTKGQANSYGGRCPDCYAKYYGDYDTHMGNCERCGDRVDLDHTNEGWGYTHLCSECTSELQAEESANDATPYAG